MQTATGWRTEAFRLRARGHDASAIAKLIGEPVEAVREALRARRSRSAVKTPPDAGADDDGAKPSIGAGKVELLVAHQPRTPRRVIVDQASLKAAALAFSRHEIDRPELLRRISRP